MHAERQRGREDRAEEREMGTADTEKGTKRDEERFTDRDRQTDTHTHTHTRQRRERSRERGAGRHLPQMGTPAPLIDSSERGPVSQLQL